MRRERIVAARLAIFTIMVIVAIGWALARLVPPHWRSCELVLLSACIALVWECFRAGDQTKAQEIRRTGVSLAPSSTAWFGASAADLRDARSREFRPWDVEQAISRLRPVNSATTPRLWRTASDSQSVEQLTNEMLTQAFRHSPKH